MENVQRGSLEMSEYTHLLSAAPCDDYSGTFEVLDTVKGYAGLKLDVKNFPFVLQLKMMDKICILQREDDLGVLNVVRLARLWVAKFP